MSEEKNESVAEDATVEEIDIRLSDEDREKALDELVALSQEMGGYDDVLSSGANEVKATSKPERIDLWNDGFVQLLEVSGSDTIVDNDATISTGKAYNDEVQEKRTDEQRRNLLRYLTRHKHTSPLEMGTVKFYCRMPLFVMRQFVRHRTASLNEYSGRYSKMIESFYVPDPSYVKKQSTLNKQGSGEPFSEFEQNEISQRVEAMNNYAWSVYQELLEQGVANEMARLVLPVTVYTEVVWKINLHNFFHFAKLRTDSHAQKEIQDLSNAMVELAQPHFPHLFEAWEDYGRGAYNLSRLEQLALADYIRDGMLSKDPDKYGMSKREYNDFRDFLSKLKDLGNE